MGEWSDPDVDSDENVVAGTEGAQDERSVWQKAQEALGLGFWSYAGFGLALFILTLNNTLGLGWLARLIGAEGSGPRIDVNPQVQILPLDDPSNLLP